MKTKVIVLLNQFLDATNQDRFDVDFKDDKIEIIFWSLIKLENTKVYNKYKKKKKDFIFRKNFVYIKSYTELFYKIYRLNKNNLFLNFIGQSILVNLAEYFLTMRGCIKLKVYKEEFYFTYDDKDKKVYQFKKIFEFGFLFAIKKFFHHFYKKIGLLLNNSIAITPKYFFVSNEYQLKECNAKRRKNVFKFQSMLITQSKRIIKLKRKFTKNFVYIDQEYEKSFESKVTRNKFNLINRTKYWNCINSIFDKIEKNYNSKILIAAHFRRINKSLPKINRKFNFHNTVELIYKSKLVIAHNSTAVFYAIIFNKPMIFLNFKILDSIALFNSKVTSGFSEYLGTLKIDIDIDYKYKIPYLNKFNLFKIKKKNYQKFYKNFIGFRSRSNKPKKLWLSISNNLNKITTRE